MAKYDIAVIGLGRFGSALALRLEQNGQRVLGVDVDESVVENLKEDIRHLAIAEARDEEALGRLIAAIDAQLAQSGVSRA